MNSLPDEILHEIFLFVPFDLHAIRLVNKRFNRTSQCKKIENVWFDDLPKEIQKLKESFPLTLSSVESLYLYKKTRYKKQGHVQLQNVDMDSNFLHLSNTRIVTIPLEIGQLTKLQFLFLQHNKIVTIPPEIGQLINLRGLYLESNQLTSLPEEIGKLTNLVYLSVYENPIVHFPCSIRRLPNLSPSTRLLFPKFASE